MSTWPHHRFVRRRLGAACVLAPPLSTALPAAPHADAASLQAIRGGTLSDAEAHSASVLGWCIEWLQAFFLGGFRRAGAERARTRGAARASSYALTVEEEGAASRAACAEQTAVTLTPTLASSPSSRQWRTTSWMRRRRGVGSRAGTSCRTSA